MKNKLLQDATAGVSGQIAPEFRQAYDKIVDAGMQVAMNKGLQGMLGGIEKRGDPIRDAAQGAVNLVFMLRMKATGQMPEQAMVPASYTLMLQALAFIEEAGIATIGEAELTRATHVWTNTIFARANISPAMLRQGAQQVSGLLNDPNKVEMLNLATGYSRDPRAPQPLGRPMETPPPMNRRDRRRARRARKRGAKGGADVAA